MGNRREYHIFFRTLVDQSKSNKFDQTIVVNTAISVSGLYQCRANLSQTDCKTCVEKLTDIIPTQCKAATAKVVDCNMTYEVVRNHVIHSADGGQDYGGCIGAFVASVVAIVVSMLLN
ncbi:cysteine-rich repeat secretory protein 11 [Artemisia annua]|uniref:Cysteine-rich repeat secretory protein 11 n=1 Tax=Artemisia annua TaxID=35608 RepID=A0A2U1MQB8_ARTAN|nr:cysteine-rich repeat secretory protein 11 [Artemisia annua]